MKLTQLSLFLENKPAHLKVPCRALADAGISIMTSRSPIPNSLASSA